jgi:hypothetical protein
LQSRKVLIIRLISSGFAAIVKEIHQIFVSVISLWRLEAANQRNMRWLILNKEGKK